MYPYVTFYGTRTFSDLTGVISIYYDDTKEQTTSFTATITDSHGTVVYTYTVASTDMITLNWGGAVNSATYTVKVVVEHGLYGDLEWSQTFPSEGGVDLQLFSLSFLGNWSFNTAYIIPALLVLFAAGCFSVLNAEVGALLATIFGIVLAYLGWLPIPVGALVSAFSLAILMALVYNKRRTGYY
jgi:hypothetical protein